MPDQNVIVTPAGMVSPHEIALLTAGVGDIEDAGQQLQDLLAYVRRVQGPNGPEASDIEALLAHLTRGGKRNEDGG